MINDEYDMVILKDKIKGFCVDGFYVKFITTLFQIVVRILDIFFFFGLKQDEYL